MDNDEIIEVEQRLYENEDKWKRDDEDKWVLLVDEKEVPKEVIEYFENENNTIDEIESVFSSLQSQQR